MPHNAPARDDDLLLGTECRDSMGDEEEERSHDGENLKFGGTEEGEDGCHVNVASGMLVNTYG